MGLVDCDCGGSKRGSRDADVHTRAADNFMKNHEISGLPGIDSQ